MRFFLYSFTLTALLIPYNFSHAVRCPHCDHLRDECYTVRIAVTQRGGGATGKWKDDVTPKRGWTCIKAEDLGEGITQQCEMCEVQHARYVHYMEHGTSPQLKVGCDCSAYMEGRHDNDAYIASTMKTARSRQSRLENRLDRRANFPDLKKPKWQTSKTGNPHIKYEGHHIIISSNKFKRGKYCVSIDGDFKLVPGSYDSIVDAKLAAFDHLNPPPTPRPQLPILEHPLHLGQVPSAGPTSYPPPALQRPIHLGQVPSADPALYHPPVIQSPIDPAQIPSADPTPYPPPALRGPVYSGTLTHSRQEDSDEEITQQLDKTHL